MQLTKPYRLRVMNDFGTLTEEVGEWTDAQAQAKCLSLASDTLDATYLCACRLGKWESRKDTFICGLFHKIASRVTHQLRVEPLSTRDALAHLQSPALN